MLPTVNVYQNGPHLALKVEPFSAKIVKIIQTIPSVRWAPEVGSWLVEAAHSQDALTALAGVPHKLADGVAKSVHQHAASAAHELAKSEIVSFEALGYTPKSEPYSPFKHQIKITTLAAKCLKFAFLMEQGTGKTRACIDTLSALIQMGVIRGALIVVPKAVLFNWAREIAMFSPLPSDKRRTMVIAAGDRKDQLELAYNANLDFVVCSYETCRDHESMVLQILRNKPMAIVLDESTRIKNHASQTAKALHRLRHSSVARFILTGTPITDGPIDAFSQFLFLDENIIGHHNFFSFKAEYARMGGYRGREVVAYKNLDRLSAKIAPWSYRVLKKDCLDIPAKVYRTIELEMSPVQEKLYKQMKKESILEHDGLVLTAPVVLTRLLRLQQITSGFIPDIDEFGKHLGYKNLNGSKIDALMELVEAARESKQKTIIWTRFTEELLAVVARIGAGVVAYHGQTSAADRQAAVDAFQTDPACDIFVGQIQAGGMGITLTAAVNVVYLSNSFSLNDRLQSEDRAHRIGQTNSVTYTDIVIKASIDGFILKTLKDKKDVADVITGDNLRQLFGEE